MSMPRLAATLLALSLAGAGAAETTLEIDSPLLRLPEAQRQQAVNDLLAPAMVKLVGGRVSLADCVAALAASGNATTLADGVDATRTADVVSVDGTYWEAVAAVCTAFALEPRDGVAAGGAGGRRGDGERGGVAVQTGPLELAAPDGARALLVPCGPVLAMVVDCELMRSVGARRESTGELALALRLEPRVASERLGEASARLTRIEDQRGRVVPHQPAAADGNESISELRARLTFGEEPATLLAVGELKLDLVEPWRLSTPLKPGESATIACAGKSLTLRLVDAEHQGLSGGQGPLLELFFPRDVLSGDPRLQLTHAARTIQPRGSGGSHTANGRVVFATYGALEHEVYQAAIAGAVRLAAAHKVDLRIPVDLARLGTDPVAGPVEIRQFEPSRLEWPAGPVTLQQALARLEPGGNQVLLQLGADERATREMPAFAGTFWEGVLAVCGAFGLDVLPPTAPPVGVAVDDGDGRATACLAGGPLGLGPKRPNAPVRQACGPLLIEIAAVSATATRGLAGGGRSADAVCHVRVEPRVDAEAVAWCSVSIDTFARDDRGRAVTIADDGASADGDGDVDEGGRMRVVRMMGRNRFVVDQEQPQPRYDLTVDASGLAPDATSVTVTGQARIAVQRRVAAEAALAPGVAVSIPYGDGTIVASLYDQASAEAVGLRQPALGLSGHGNLAESSMQLIAPSGAVLSTNGHGSWTRHGRQEVLYLYPITEAGAHRLVINDVAHIGVVRLPFTAALQLP